MTYRNTGWKAQLYGDLRVPPGGLIPDEAIPSRAIDHLVRMGMIELVHEAPAPSEPPAAPEPPASSPEPEPEPEPDVSVEGVSAVDEPPAEPEPAPKRRAPRKPRTT